MKILIFLASHRQLDEFKYFNIFLEKTKELKTMCDLYIHINNPRISQRVLNYYKEFKIKNKKIYITTKNSGYASGGMEAINDSYKMGIFNNYDYVIHMHPDVFITEETELIKLLKDNLNNNKVFLVTKYFPWKTFEHYATDFFIFKPKLLKNNIFDDENLYKFKPDKVETFFYNILIKNNINCLLVKRFNNDHWYPRRIDNLKLWHEHDLNKIKKFLHL